MTPNSKAKELLSIHGNEANALQEVDNIIALKQKEIRDKYLELGFAHFYQEVKDRIKYLCGHKLIEIAKNK